jgi:hypothetical protein
MDELARRPSPLGFAQFRERSHEELLLISHSLYESGFYDLKNAAQGYAKMFYGQTLGLSPIESLNLIHAVQSGGKTTLIPHYTIIAAKIRRHPNYDFRLITNTDTECTVEFFRRDEETGKMVLEGTSTYTRIDAVAAGLVNNPAWKAHIKDMLYSNAIKKGAKRYAPDVMVFPDDEPVVRIDQWSHTEVEARELVANFFHIFEEKGVPKQRVIDILRAAGIEEINSDELGTYYGVVEDGLQEDAEYAAQLQTETT